VQLWTAQGAKTISIFAGDKSRAFYKSVYSGNHLLAVYQPKQNKESRVCVDRAITAERQNGRSTQHIFNWKDIGQ
jgi:hypothetical protein